MSLFTEAELRLLKLSDKVEDQGENKTDKEREAQYSRESRERRRARMGEVAYRAMCREREARKIAKRKAKLA